MGPERLDRARTVEAIAADTAPGRPPWAGCAAGDGGFEATNQTKEVGAAMKRRRARYAKPVGE